MYLIGSFECTCKTGYVGDGQFCADENECLTGTSQCDPLADCTNTDASYTCTCPTVSSEIISFYPISTKIFQLSQKLISFQGYIPGGDPSGQTCTEQDECTDGTNDCDANASCVNLPPGSFTCNCNTGYAGTGQSCSDIDECDLDLHDCDAFADCQNTVGSWECTCKDGYESALTPPARTGDCNNIGKSTRQL